MSAVRTEHFHLKCSENSQRFFCKGSPKALHHFFRNLVIFQLQTQDVIQDGWDFGIIAIILSITSHYRGMMLNVSASFTAAIWWVCTTERKTRLWKVRRVDWTSDLNQFLLILKLIRTLTATCFLQKSIFQVRKGKLEKCLASLTHLGQWSATECSISIDFGAHLGVFYIFVFC